MGYRNYSHGNLSDDSHNSIIKLIGEKRVENFTKKLTRFTIARYTLVPVLAVLFLGNPMCYTFGRFVEEKYKPAYYDSCVSFLHPVTGLFPHANPGELFVYMGIAAGADHWCWNQMKPVIRSYV